MLLAMGNVFFEGAILVDDSELFGLTLAQLAVSTLRL